MTKTKGFGVNGFLKFAVAVCAFGLLMIPILYFFGSSHAAYPAFSKELVGSLFESLCLVGSVAAFYPDNCEGIFIFKSQQIPREEEASGDHEEIRFSGHHPGCQRFSSNRIKLRRSVLCASCIGLFIGALTASIGSTFYFFIPIIPSVPSIALLSGSYVCLLLGLLQYKFKGWSKLAANSLFVFGSLWMLIAVDAKKNLVIDLFGIVLIVFLLLTRISISQWNNKRICAKCSSCLLRS